MSRRDSVAFLSDCLPTGAGHLRAHHSLMLRALAHEDGSWWTDAGSCGVRAAIAALAARPLAEVLDATPFFWFNLSRLSLGLAHDERPTRAELARLHVTAFDSFPELVGETVVRGWQDGVVVLPRCGVELGAVGPELRLSPTLQGTGAGCIRVGGAAGGRVLASRSRALFDEHSREQIDPDVDLVGFAGQLAEAHALIARVKPSLLERMGERITWYVPLHSPDERTHRSFTLEQQSGVMFLSPTHDRVRLAEAMVHELGHTELGHTVRGRPLLRDEQALALGDECYSPWRPDPRPLIGLLHALYVFCEVASFLEGLLAVRELEDVHAWVVQRRTLSLLRVWVGLAQVPREALAPFGVALVERISELVGRHAQVLRDAAPELRAAIDRHLAQWCGDHPGLRAVAPRWGELAQEAIPWRT